MVKYKFVSAVVDPLLPKTPFCATRVFEPVVDPKVKLVPLFPLANTTLLFVALVILLLLLVAEELKLATTLVPSPAG